MILVVGATGQLGTAVVRKLVAAGRPVRAFVRQDSHHAHLAGQPVELAVGDLRDLASVAAACAGVDTVIATANSVIRRPGDTFAAVDGQGYEHLIAGCKQAGVTQLIYASVPVTPMDAQVPALRYKRLTEQRIQASGLGHTIVRLSVFMDVWLALLGSSTAVRGAEVATVARPFWFSQAFMGIVGGMMEQRGLALVPGSGRTRHAFITVDDVARFMVGCVGHPAAQGTTFHLGGPEVLSLNEAVGQVAAAIGRPVRPIHLPAGVARAQQVLLRPLGEGPSNIMGMNWMMGSVDSAYSPADGHAILGDTLTTMRQFLQAKLAAPVVAPVVGRAAS